MIVEAGSLLTFSINHASPLAQGYADVLQKASALLRQNDGINVLKADPAGSGFVTQVEGILSIAPIPYTVTMQVQTSQDYAKPSDVESIIFHELYEATGEKIFPTGGTVTEWITPQGDFIPTGQTEQTGPGGQPKEKGLNELVSDFFSKLGTLGTTLLIAAIGIIVLVLVLVAYGPNVGSVARAAAVV